ncbi:MAG: diguanylate cyclase [Planctomycetota bacterium]
MYDRCLLDIAKLCQSLEKKAVTVYRRLAANSSDGNLASFWKRMAKEETEHLDYWRQLAALVRNGVIPDIFDEKLAIRAELRKLNERVERLLKLGPRDQTVLSSFALAFSLEFSVLHPAMARFWRFTEMITKPGTSPGSTYDTHIREFIDAAHRHAPADPVLELFGEAIGALWQNYQIVAHTAETDWLTGLLNRRGLMDACRALAHLAKRNQFVSGVLMIDVDGFKKINDTHGHLAGDDVLKLVGQAIQRTVRHSDVVGRYGGDEFLVYCPQIGDHGQGVLADKIRLAIRQASTPTVSVTASVGAACQRILKNPERSLLGLIALADRNLYAAKAAGRDRVVGG